MHFIYLVDIQDKKIKKCLISYLLTSNELANLESFYLIPQDFLY